MAFEGPRNDNFDLVDGLKRTVAEVLAIKDEIGAKKANVYLYKKIGAAEPVWTQILPSPTIAEYSLDPRLIAGGEIQQGDLLLRGIPQANYTEEELNTATETEGEERYFVVDKRAYTLAHLRKNYLTFDILIRRYDAVNEEDLVPPPASG